MKQAAIKVIFTASLLLLIYYASVELPYAIAVKRQSDSISHLESIGGQVYPFMDIVISSTFGTHSEAFRTDLTVDLSGLSLSDADLYELKNLSSEVAWLNLEGAQFNNELFAEIVPSFTKLFDVRLSNSTVNNASMREILRLPDITMLFSEDTGISSEAFNSISRTGNHPPGIQILKIPYLTEEGWKSIGKLNGLLVLHVQGGDSSSIYLKHLAHLSYLTKLNLSSADFNSEDIKQLSSMTTLKSLSIHGSNVTNDDLMVLSENSTLEEILIQNTQVDDEGIIHLAQAKNLELVNCQDTLVTLAGLKKLKVLRPDLEILSDVE